MNIRHAFIISVSMLESCTDIINKIYSKNEKEYYELYFNSQMYEDDLKETLPIEILDKTNKLIGIVEKCYRDKNFMVLEKIVSKVNPSILRFIKTANKVNATKFYKIYLEKHVDNIEEYEVFANVICLMYMSNLKGKEVVGGEGIIYFIEGLWKVYQNVLLLQAKASVDIANDKELCDKIAGYYKKLHLEPFEKIETQTVNLFIEKYIEKSIDIDFKSTEKNKLEADIDEYKRVRNEQFKKDISKYIGCFSRYINTLGINSELIFSFANMDEKTLSVIFQDFVNAKEYNNVPESEADIYITSCLMLYNFVELYKKSKDIILNKTKEKEYKDLVDYEHKLNKKEEEMKAIVDKNNQIIKAKDSEIQRLKEEIKLLKANNNKSENMIKSLINENEELSKEFIAVNSKEITKEMVDIEEHSDIPLEKIIENLKDKKIAIFGGANSIRNIKEVLPNIMLFNDINKDISSIKKADLIVLNADFISHSFTYKLNAAVNKYNTEYKYICGTNIERILITLNKYLNNKQ